MALRGNQNRRVAWQDVRPLTEIKKPTDKKRLEITLVLPSLPKLKVVKKIKTKLNTRRRKVVAIVILCIIFAAIMSWYFLFGHNNMTSKNTPSAKITLAKGTPNFDTILPDGKSSNDVGGWTRVSPPTSNAVYAYVDKIGTIQISVSEQPLPDNFKTNSENQIQQLAEAQGASEKITLGSVTIHIGTYDGGLQRAIFTKDNLLVLITSNNTVSNNQWASYVNSLN